MKGNLGAFAIAAVIVACLVAAIYGKVAVWQECRADHSWLYCFHLISN